MIPILPTALAIFGEVGETQLLYFKKTIKRQTGNVIFKLMEFMKFSKKFLAPVFCRPKASCMRIKFYLEMGTFGIYCSSIYLVLQLLETIMVDHSLLVLNFH